MKQSEAGFKKCLIPLKLQDRFGERQHNILSEIIDVWTENLRYNELLNVVDELLSHHDDEKLLSQFNEAAAGTTLQHREKINKHTDDTAEHVCIKIQKTNFGIFSPFHIYL